MDVRHSRKISLYLSKVTWYTIFDTYHFVLLFIILAPKVTWYVVGNNQSFIMFDGPSSHIKIFYYKLHFFHCVVFLVLLHTFINSSFILNFLPFLFFSGSDSYQAAADQQVSEVNMCKSKEGLASSNHQTVPGDICLSCEYFARSFNTVWGVYFILLRYQPSGIHSIYTLAVWWAVNNQ